MPDFAREAEGSRTAKVALRNQLLTARKGLPEAVRRSAAASVQATTVAWVRNEEPTRCAAYVPVGAEPGGPGLVDALAAVTRLLLPVLLPDGDLDWASYDGALARATTAYKVALLHDGELLDEVPTEPHDRPIDAVITPSDGLTTLPRTPPSG